MMQDTVQKSTAATAATAADAGLAQFLGDRVANLAYADLPAEAIRWARVGVLDTVGVTLAGAVTDYAGTGIAGHTDAALGSAQFFNPKGMAIDAAGVVYITEAGNHDIRKIENNFVSTLAGTVDQLATLMRDRNEP